MSSKKNNKPPSLKSASGEGFTFEDKVAAVLLGEMLAGVSSLGIEFGGIQKLERQAVDWEPFGDLLLDIIDSEGNPIRFGGSVKSNRVINANGCDAEICAGMWATLANSVFKIETDFLWLISTPLSAVVSDHVNGLCRQAKAIDAERLDQKIVHANMRKIYESFHNTEDTTTKGLPGNILAKLIHREFDFGATVSRSEKEAASVCRDLLRADEQSPEKINALWRRLCEISEELRISGGALTRAGISGRLRERFGLKDDPSDAAAWVKLRTLSREAMEEISTSLPGNLRLPRKAESTALWKAITGSGSCHVLGDSGSGKSAMIKGYAAEIQAAGAEVVWIKAERLRALVSALPDLLDVLGRCRRTSALLVIDALEGCTLPESFDGLAKLIAGVAGVENSLWSVIVACQTPDWNRASSVFIKHFAGSPVLTKRVECDLLAKEDFDLVCAASPTVAKLANEPKLQRFLSTPKMLDVLLSGQLAENREIAGEADLVEWWWEQQVRGYSKIATEERVARELASRMADELRSELPPDSVSGAEEATDKLIRNRVIKLTRDRLLRFEHDLLADWSRVMHLRGLGHEKLSFLKAHTENPPWLRAVKLLSQHLLDRVADIDQWREFLNRCKTEEGTGNELSAENLQIIDAWLEGVIFSLNPAQVLAEITTDLFDNDGWLLHRLLRRLMLVGTIPDPVFQERYAKIDPKAAEQVATHFRLPMGAGWSPIIKFLSSHSEFVTEVVAIELGEIAEVWARLEDHTSFSWSELAELVVLNAEKELRREVSGEYRFASKSRSFSGTRDARKTIYLGALFAAIQSPDRVAKLVSKAAGIAQWEDGDVSPKARRVWLGEWSESRGMFSGDSQVEKPLKSWPRGPMRETSGDFFDAWFESAAAVRVFRMFPDTACNATLGFLLDWPKRRLSSREFYGSGSDGYGFTSEADQMYPAFYTQAPFLQFLRENWEPAVHLIVELTNFATERYADWWSDDSKPSSLKFSTKYGDVSWFGNHHVYGWSRYHMNTAQVVTCALMALEKWLEERIKNNESITAPIQLLYKQGRSQAFAGLLIALGKRYPGLFLDELKPLLFSREFYMYDMRTVREWSGGSGWLQDGKVMNDLRREWEMLPGRKSDLMELTREWLIMREEFLPVLNEVALAWRVRAAALPEESEDKLPLRHWAATFDRENWKPIALPDGREGWQYEVPEELRDVDGTEAQMRAQALLIIPWRCSEILEKRAALSSEQFNGIWEQLRNWSAFEQASQQYRDGDEFESSLRDHRHARAGLIAVLLCLGANGWPTIALADHGWRKN